MTVYRVIGRSQGIDFTVAIFDNKESAVECKDHMETKQIEVSKPLLGNIRYTVIPTQLFSTLAESLVV